MLSRARQYADAKARFQEAIALAPEWSNPWTDLGLLLMQSGDEEEARDTLRQAVKLDAFRRDAVNQLRLVEDLLGYKTIRTEHFLIRYKDGIDEALARDMPPVLEQIYRDVTGTFGFKPKNPTLIELFPDSRSFAVRITGMPFIWTIGASTGDVIALASPRSGAVQSGAYDWPRVVRHEFAHTVTLGMTQNRIPHWFTEACAVNQEPGDKSFDTCLLLALSLQKNELFDLHEINWAFVRPKRPNDRALAYAQAAWMMEYIVETYGFTAILKLLEGYRDGKHDVENFQAVTSRSAEQFLSEFRSWAHNQVAQWGLSPLKHEPRVSEAILSSAATLEKIDSLLAEFPDDRRLLRKRAELVIGSGQTDQARQALYAYSRAVPVDPWPYQELLKLGPNPRNPREQTGALEFLDASEVTSGRWSMELARAYRAGNMLPQSVLAARRAVEREPFNPAYRELLATLLVQSRKLEEAAHEIQALMILEPDAVKHRQRLIAIYRRLGREEDAMKLEQKPGQKPQANAPDGGKSPAAPSGASDAGTP
jgi:Flp pilus assembly protein TadD